MRKLELPAAILMLASLSACSTGRPSSPSIAVLPGEGKSYAAFQKDDYDCRTAAAQSIGYDNSQQASSQAAVGSAVTGTLVGTAAGAAIGAAAGNAGAGAAAGAGVGLLAGSAAGAANAAAIDSGLQYRYDVAYAQCMAAKGNQVPPLLPPGSATYSPPVAGYYPYMAYPPLFAFYPGYGYLYPNVSIIYGWGWDGWYRHGHHR